MSTPATELEQLVENAMAAVAAPAPDEMIVEEHIDMRKRFFEFLPLVLGNLYGKTPLAASLFDRATMLRITNGMDDNDAGKLTGRTEDWMRLEGLVRQQEGQKTYFLTRPSMAVLSIITSGGTLGEVLQLLLMRYLAAPPTTELRVATRLLGAYVLTRMARS